MAVAGLHNFPPFPPSSVVEFRFGSRISSSLEDDEPLTPQTPGSSTFVHGLSSPISDLTENDCMKCSEMENENESSYLSEQSSEFEGTDRERVRQVFQGWMKNGCIWHSSDRLGAQWLSDNECERVRVIRERVLQMSSQQRKNCELLRDKDAEACSQIEVRNGLVVVSQSGMAAKRPIRRICGRQTLFDLLQRAQQERKRELVALLEIKPVSEFAHRIRIQALLRSRFLRNKTLIPEKKPSSVAAMEIGLLRERRTVSGLREEFISKSDNPLTLISNTEVNSLSGDENNSESESLCKEMVSTYIPSASDVDNPADGTGSVVEFTTEVTDELQLQGSSSIIKNSPEVSSDMEDDNFDDAQLTLQWISAAASERESDTIDVIHCKGELEVCHEHSECSSVVDHLTDTEGTINDPSESLCSNELHRSVAETEDIPSERLTNHWLNETSDNDDDGFAEQDQILELQQDWPSQGSARNSELRELFSRRRVSSLLQSSFRESLDQVLQSHVGRQGFMSDDFDTFSSPEPIDQTRRELNEDQDSAFLDEKFQHRFSDHHLWTEWDVIDELRINMDQIQERMNSIQNMVEECMDMQIELQRSIRHEVSSALTRSITLTGGVSTHDHESNWNFLRKGICCICHESSINSLLYRCGHMCSCYKCAEELVRSTGQCPMCKVPVIDTFQTN